MNLLFIQNEAANVVATMADVSVPEVTEAKINLLELAVKGGWLMIPLLLLLVIAVAVFIERLLVINKVSKPDDSFMNRIKDYIHDGKIDSAIKLCKKTETPYARMIEKGISRLGRPMNDIQVAIENVGDIEVAKLEKGLPWVATTAGGAPMIGFLGTVTGMVRAFFDMSSAGSNVDITLLSSGIYEALVTTVAGLIVGIIAMFGYNYLTSRLNGVVNQMESNTMEFMDLLNEPTN
jgi:Biopolymer transport proteins